MTARDPDLRVGLDLAAAIAARRDLGPEFEEAIAEGLVERIEGLMDSRAESRGSALDVVHASVELEKKYISHRYVVALASLGVGIPITAVSAEGLGLLGTLVAWTGIVGVNVAHALGRPRRRTSSD